MLVHLYKLYQGHNKPLGKLCVPAQAVGFLVIHQKQKKTLDEIMNDLCPVLSVQQLYRIATMYWDHKFGTETVAQVRAVSCCCSAAARPACTHSPLRAEACKLLERCRLPVSCACSHRLFTWLDRLPAPAGCAGQDEAADD